MLIHFVISGNSLQQPCERRGRWSSRAALACARAAVFQEFGEIIEIVILRDRRTNLHQASRPAIAIDCRPLWLLSWRCAARALRSGGRRAPAPQTLELGGGSTGSSPSPPCHPSPFALGCATALLQGCCFVKFNSLIAAQSAINALHNQRSLPPLRNPLQVRFADSGVNSSDRGHQTNAENKLFVGGVPTGCGDKELRALFSTYGEVLDVYILASKASQEGQRGCAFVRYSTPQSCAMAIEALHGKYAMKTGELPLVVRYADRL